MATLTERIEMSKHGDGSLAKYSDSPNWISVYSLHGKEHRQSTKTPDKKKARAIHKKNLTARVLDKEGIMPMLTPKVQQVTVATLLDAWEKDIELRGLKSAYKLRSHAKPITTYFGSRRAVTVTSETVDQYIKALQQQDVADATINRRLQILGAAFKLAVTRKQIPSAPAIRKLSEAGNARQGFFEQAEVDAVVAALPEHLKDLTRFAYATGWRKSEIIGVSWDMVKDNVLVLPDSKNGRPRRLPIAGEVAEILSRQTKARTYTRPDGEPRVADLIFHRGGRSVGDFKKQWASALKAAGLTHEEKDPTTGAVTTVHDRLFHDLRRSAARRLLRAGVQQITAMKLLGHRTPSMFTRYAITSDGDLREALERVEAAATA